MQGSPDYPVFRPRFPWWGGHLQTIRNFLLSPPEAPPGERIVLPLQDGTGDRLSAVWSGEDRGRPLAVLIHGLTGCEESTYILRTAWHLLETGFPVLRLNLRGAGPSRTLCRGYYHAGRSADLAAALSALERQRPAWLVNGLVMVGYSLGGNMVLKFAAESGTAFPLRAAVTVSAPIDLAAASQCMMRLGNRPYHRWLLDRMKTEILGGALTAAERRTVAGVHTIYALDDRFIGPHHGFADAEDYYQSCSALRFLDRVTTRTLMIMADDDPWIPAEPYHALMRRDRPGVHVLLAPGGGHVGFHGCGSAVPWHDRCMARFLQRQPA